MNGLDRCQMNPRPSVGRVADTVGNTAAELAFSGFRQDAGFGLSVRVLGPVLLAYSSGISACAGSGRRATSH
jgi:hypothetical protein